MAWTNVTVHFAFAKLQQIIRENMKYNAENQ